MSTPYKTFSYHTFGCKVNFADSSFIARELVKEGYNQIPIEANADICLINTCSVTENADKKAKKMIRNIHKQFPQTKIIVYGCYAQLNPAEISDLKGVATVVGTEKKFSINEIISKNKLNKKSYNTNIDNVKKFDISYSLNERTRAFIKIQDGCDYNCSYCTIPNARGRSRSLDINNTINEIKKIINTGINEIVLSGINIGDFGIQHNENLYELLKNIEKIKQLKRFRISSIEPNLLSNEILRLFSKSKKALPHFHLPLQSGSDKVLKLMKRRYSCSDYIRIINKVKKYLPKACIGVDVIVGFPGETEIDFHKTYDLLNEQDISYLHVFSYSERENTFSQEIYPKIPDSTIVLRRNKLRSLSKDKYKQFVSNQKNNKFEVLFEKYEDGGLSGWTQNYIKVNVIGIEELLNTINTIELRPKQNNFINGILLNE